MILTAHKMRDADFIIRDYQIYLVVLLLLVTQAAMSMLSTKQIGRLNTLGAGINFVLLFLFIFWMPFGSINSPKVNPSRYAWTGFVNQTEWPTGFAVLFSSLSVLYTLAGFDAPFHMSEECTNASIAVPRSISLAGSLGAFMGLPVVIVIA